MKYFFISDVHGQYDKMRRALAKNGFDQKNENHMLVVVGDFLDDGPKQLQALRYIKKLKNLNKALVVRGNHEDYHLQRHGYMDPELLTEIKYLYQKEKIDISFKAYKQAIIIEIENFVKSLPYYIETDKFVAAHAGIDPTLKDWRKGKVGGWDYCDSMSWMLKDHIKRLNEGAFKNFPKKVISGHLYNIDYFFWEKYGYNAYYVDRVLNSYDENVPIELIGKPYIKDQFICVDGMWHNKKSEGIVYIIE